MLTVTCHRSVRHTGLQLRCSDRALWREVCGWVQIWNRRGSDTLRLPITQTLLYSGVFFARKRLMSTDIRWRSHARMLKGSIDRELQEECGFSEFRHHDQWWKPSISSIVINSLDADVFVLNWLFKIWWGIIIKTIPYGRLLSAEYRHRTAGRMQFLWSWTLCPSSGRDQEKYIGLGRRLFRIDL